MRGYSSQCLYESKGYFYQTDELGRIKAAQGGIRLEDGASKRPKEFNIHYFIDGKEVRETVSNGD